MKSKDFFDNVYASCKEPYFGDKPSEELRDYVLTSKLKGKALDIGCGDGRDTLFLAAMGFFVTAIDTSRVALQKLVKFARSMGLEKRVMPIRCDARCWNYPISFFDLVTSATCLDHIPEKDLASLLTKITSCLKPGGILFLEAHTIDDPGFGRTPGRVSELSSRILHYFSRNELLRLVEQEFYIIRYEEKIEEDRDHGEPHVHGFANVLAQRRVNSEMRVQKRSHPK